MSGPGPLALVGGAEFGSGNEPHDGPLADAARRHGGPAYVVATAAREAPDAAVHTARAWFASLGLEVTELRLRTRRDAGRTTTVEAARAASLFYVAGGDPGRVPAVLAGTPAWEAILGAWRAGAGLAGSSAGAMALGSWTLVRARMPGDARREARAGLGVVPGIAVVPHLDTFGAGWLASVAPLAAPAGVTLLCLDERTAAVWTADASWRSSGPGQVTVLAPDGTRGAFHDERVEGLPTPR